MPYVAGWASDDPAVIERDAGEIDRIAARLEGALESGAAGKRPWPSELAACPDRRVGGRGRRLCAERRDLPLLLL